MEVLISQSCMPAGMPVKEWGGSVSRDPHWLAQATNRSWATVEVDEQVFLEGGRGGITPILYRIGARWFLSAGRQGTCNPNREISADEANGLIQGTATLHLRGSDGSIDFAEIVSVQ